MPASAAAAGVSAQENEKLPRVNIAPPARAGFDRRNTKDLTLRLGDELQKECPEISVLICKLGGYFRS